MSIQPNLQTITSKRWQIAPSPPHTVVQALDHLPPVLVQVLYNRGLHDERTIRAFLDGRYIADDDPFLLADMVPAVERIIQAVEREENVVVYGDFDADGVSSSVLLVQTLRGLGLPRRNVRPYIPDRVDEGYGLNKDALSTIKNEFGGDLVITVDCGIRSIGEVEHANQIGLDMIVTDHHSIGAAMPPALAVINPKRPDNAYPERNLAGVGTAYKLAQAVNSRLPAVNGFQLEQQLDLVALGTVADIVPLQGENRQLVTRGLEVLNQLNRPGFTALAQVAGLKAGQITAESIGFSLGPRVNAAGRMAHAYDAARLLASNNLLQARQMADHLNQLNQQRQRITAELNDHAVTLIDNPEDQYLLMVADKSFQSGVVGLVAGRLTESYYRPTIILKADEEESHGSCRSIPELDITGALDQVADLLERYGGHAAAAGLTIRNENLPEFRERMEAIATEKLRHEDLRPTIVADAELKLSEINWSLVELLAQLEPTGCENATPIFISRSVDVVHHRVVGRDQTHLQINVAVGDEKPIQCIAFRQAEWAAHLPAKIDLAYTISVNEWRGRRRIQLNIQDIHLAA